MADPYQQPLLQWRLTMVVLAIGVFVASDHVAAEIILDDFRDSASAEIRSWMPEFVETPNIGELGASRQIRIATGGTDPVGSFDINVNSPGKMTVQIEEIKPTITGLPLTAVQFNYVFDPIDVTEGGQNGAILLELADLVGDIQPTYLRALVVDDTNVGSFEIRIQPLVANDSRHTLAMPFDAFSRRGGAPGLPDPTKLKAIYFDFYFLGHHGKLNWSVQLERIRFGSAVVPEPETTAIIWAGIVSWGWYGFMWKGVWNDVSPRQAVPVCDTVNAHNESRRKVPTSPGSGLQHRKRRQDTATTR